MPHEFQYRQPKLIVENGLYVAEVRPSLNPQWALKQKGILEKFNDKPELCYCMLHFLLSDNRSAFRVYAYFYHTFDRINVFKLVDEYLITDPEYLSDAVIWNSSEVVDKDGESYYVSQVEFNLEGVKFTGMLLGDSLIEMEINATAIRTLSHKHKYRFKYVEIDPEPLDFNRFNLNYRNRARF